MYGYPYFEQNWNLFVRVPSSNYHLYVKVIQNGKASWKDVIIEVLSKHRSNRIAGQELVLLAFVNHIHYIEQKITLNTSNPIYLKDDQEFIRLQQMAKNYLLSKSIQVQQNPPILLTIQNTKTKITKVVYR